MALISGDSVPLRRPDLVTVEAEDQLLVHYPGLLDTVSLNVSAQAILELCDGQRTVAELSQELAEECGYPIEVLTNDVKCALAQFDKLGVVTLCDGKVDCCRDSDSLRVAEQP